MTSPTARQQAEQWATRTDRDFSWSDHAVAQELLRALLADLARVEAEQRCPICIDRGLSPSKAYGCYAHSQAYDSEVVKSRDAEIERLEASLARVKAERDEWQRKCEAAHG